MTMRTKYLTSLVRHKKGEEWELAFDDVLITFSEDSEFLNEMTYWLEKRLLAYPPELWDYWTVVCEQEGIWRHVDNLPSGFERRSLGRG